MQCAESLRVQAYFDGELDAAGASDVERHAERCPECGALLEALADTRAWVRRDLARESAPRELRERIVRMLGREHDTVASPGARRSARRRPWRTRPFWLGASAGVGAALAATMAFLFMSAPAADPLLDAIVAAHVRSLMPSHLTDVLSTDQHTVKPWFAGHADVSPVVADFSPQGYRLVGGRADYFEGQRVAVAVYGHGPHVINVFTWASRRQSVPDASTRNGYHVVFWKVGNLEYCAVSDTGWEELEGLVRLLRGLGARDARE